MSDLTGTQASAQIEAARQAQLDDFRKNAAYNALVQTHGAVAGDPEAWSAANKAQAETDTADLVRPTAQADLQTKTIGNQKTQQEVDQNTLFAVGALLKNNGPNVLDNPLLQKRIGIQPGEVDQYKTFVTGSDGKVDPNRVDALVSAGAGRLGAMASGGMTQVIDPATGQLTLVRGTKAGGIISNELSQGATTPQVMNANTKQNNSLVVPGQPYDLNTATTAIKQGFPGAVITSTLRTPDHNAAIGGAPNSAHTVGRAMDLGIPQGTEGPAYADQVNSYLAANKLPGHAVYESAASPYSTGPHVHYEWPAGAGGGPQVNQTYVAAKAQVAANAAKAGVSLTPEAIEMFAQEGARTGKIQTFGMGGKSNTTAIGNKMAANGVTGQQLADNQQQYKSAQSYETDLGKSSPTSAGGMARSAGVVLQHLGTLGQMIDGLQNGNLQLANKASQAFKQQTGQAAPTTFNAQKTIVGDELTRYLIARGGTSKDREEMQAGVARANSPTQLRAVMNTWITDIGAQLRGQYSQAQGMGKGPQFLSILTPEARGLLQPAQHHAAAGGGWAIKLVK